MAITQPVATQNAALAARIALIDAETDPGELRIYTTPRPAPTNGPGAATLLATVELDDPSFTTPSGGAAALAGVPREEEASGTGTAAWFRIVDGAGASVFDGSVGTTGSGANLEVDSLSFAAGVIVRITGGGLTEPDGT
jgi:hypothetical protein